MCVSPVRAMVFSTTKACGRTRSRIFARRARQCLEGQQGVGWRRAVNLCWRSNHRKRFRGDERAVLRSHFCGHASPAGDLPCVSGCQSPGSCDLHCKLIHSLIGVDGRSSLLGSIFRHYCTWRSRPICILKAWDSFSAISINNAYSVAIQPHSPYARTGPAQRA